MFLHFHRAKTFILSDNNNNIYNNNNNNNNNSNSKQSTIVCYKVCMTNYASPIQNSLLLVRALFQYTPIFQYIGRLYRPVECPDGCVGLSSWLFVSRIKRGLFFSFITPFARARVCVCVCVLNLLSVDFCIVT